MRMCKYFGNIIIICDVKRHKNSTKICSRKIIYLNMSVPLLDEARFD